MNRIRINIFFFLSLIMIALMTFVVTSAQAASARPTTPSRVATSGGLFSGNFEGDLLGDDGSNATAELEITQTGRDVISKLTIDQGLIIDGGNCGLVEVPSTTQTLKGKTPTRSPRRLEAASAFKVNGIAVTIDLDADLSRDGKSLTAEAKIDLPWLCGSDPVIVAELARVD